MKTRSKTRPAAAASAAAIRALSIVGTRSVKRKRATPVNRPVLPLRKCHVAVERCVQLEAMINAARMANWAQDLAAEESLLSSDDCSSEPDEEPQNLIQASQNNAQTTAVKQNGQGPAKKWPEMQVEATRNVSPFWQEYIMELDTGRAKPQRVQQLVDTIEIYDDNDNNVQQLIELQPVVPPTGIVDLSMAVTVNELSRPNLFNGNYLGYIDIGGTLFHQPQKLARPTPSPMQPPAAQLHKPANAAQLQEPTNAAQFNEPANVAATTAEIDPAARRTIQMLPRIYKRRSTFAGWEYVKNGYVAATNDDFN